MRHIDTCLPSVFVIEPVVFSDARGFFFESYHERKFAELGISNHFVQDNHSKSVRGTLRGLHYQLKFPQAKLCRVVQGEVLDVAVDIRRNSACFGQWMSTLLSAENKHQVYIPAGFAHGFLVLSETAEFLYKCDDFYRPEDEHGIAWNDPEIGIDWGIERIGVENLILSGKDTQNPLLRDMPLEHLPLYLDSRG
jgi:dTDP-4-dehydrorhamnose 3,5-epimerase